MAGHTVIARSNPRDMMTFWASPASTACRVVSRTSSRYLSRNVLKVSWMLLLSADDVDMGSKCVGNLRDDSVTRMA